MKKHFHPLELSCTSQFYRFVTFPPASHENILIFPFTGITGSWFCLDIIPPHIFRPFSVGPGIFARDRTGMAANALVKMKYHGDL
jgi:hypothetical protein